VLNDCCCRVVGDGRVVVAVVVLTRAGVDFTKVLHPVFMPVDLKSTKNTDYLTVFFALLGSEHESCT
jgi:hypothetical protein